MMTDPPIMRVKTAGLRCEDDNRVRRLASYLKAILPGRIDDPGGLEPLLAACWDDLGGDAGGMSGEKLHGRMESVAWNPPTLSFVIERHGATVNGSLRADLQHWAVDVEAKTAVLGKVGHRQLQPMQPRLDVRSLAEEIATLIAGGQEDHRLKRYEDGRVRVLVGKILPKGSAVKRTLEWRRKRFRQALPQGLRDPGGEPGRRVGVPGHRSQPGVL